MEAVYKPKNPIRIVTATSLFDGHDVTINIIRRVLQASGAEVIHLGHNRSVQEIVHCAIQEDAQSVAVSSYQGGHMEFYKYMVDLLRQLEAGHIKVFGGGGGVLLNHEIKELIDYGVSGLYSPDDGRNLGLQGMCNQILELSDFSTIDHTPRDLENLTPQDKKALAHVLTAVEMGQEFDINRLNNLQHNRSHRDTPVIGITGTGGAGKSTLLDELLRRFLTDFKDINIGVLLVDPSRRKTGGALLGDRIRLNTMNYERLYVRSMATRQSHKALSKHIENAVNVLKASNFDIIFLETSGIGQSDTEIIDHSDLSIYVMTPEYGADTQLEKIAMLDFADFIVLNKYDKQGAKDALRHVKKQYQRNHRLWDRDTDSMPVYGCIASQFKDRGLDRLYLALIDKLKPFIEPFILPNRDTSHKSPNQLIPPDRVRYLGIITTCVRAYNKMAEEQSHIAEQIHGLEQSIKWFKDKDDLTNIDIIEQLDKAINDLGLKLSDESRLLIKDWDQMVQAYQKDFFTFKVRDQEIKVKTFTESLSSLRIPKIALPKYRSWGDLLKWCLKENVAGEFPYAAGVYPFKREHEDPTRMFAGEGSPERTNQRFHYLSRESRFKRLSTAFDSVTLYGADPNRRPDIYGKIGNSGVSIACLDDAKKLYSGFDLADPKTSVSMTINGPAPILLGFFMNTVVDQQCEKYIRENNLMDQVQNEISRIFQEKNSPIPQYHGELPKGHDGLGLMLLGVTGDQVLTKSIYEQIKTETLEKVRGTLQADILKEDQAQNTCIFSMDFSLRLMGDVQEYFIQNNVQNFYSISISGYHMAEAGANPITQLAFTLANGFTYVEYYLARGFSIDDFAGSFSFFFSNGMDPEYSVMGRVARIIWAKAMKLRYKANSRSQKLKYHIQTSGRSLHAQEIDFNDIRTTLQALYAIFDNCNSLHTNAYNEAITTPTEESVRRAMAIQLIINHELGEAKNQNPLQGSFIIEELTDLVEEAVLSEFEKLSDRGGVLGAMETGYQRGKIQDESLHYEKLKESGDLPIMGVNTFLSSKGSPTITPNQVIRSTEEEKNNQIATIQRLQTRNQKASDESIKKLKQCVQNNGNIFESLMETTKHCSLGQITQALYEVGGQYRRNL